MKPLFVHACRHKQNFHGNLTGFLGRFPFTKKFRKSRLGCKRNTCFWFVPLENFWNKRNFWKGSPVFPMETLQWKMSAPFTGFTRVFQFQTFHGHIFGKMAAPSSVPSNSLYECPLCHGLAPDLQTLMNHECVMYANGK